WLVEFLAEDVHAENYLVRGFGLQTDFSGPLIPFFPEDEVLGEEIQWGAGGIAFTVQSGFMQLVGVADYVGARRVVERFPQAFGTPSLRGWREAVSGFLGDGNPADRFEAA